MKYQPLTKIVAENGKEFVACSCYGTETCRQIHSPNGCQSCPMLAAILNQLHAFEEAYLSGEDEDG